MARMTSTRSNARTHPHLGARGGIAPAIPARVRRRRGLSTVELAIILPVMLWLTFGIVEYGWMFLKMQEITNASRQGARVAARADVTTDEIVAAITAAMTVAGFEPNAFKIDFPQGSPVTTEPGAIFAVRIEVDYVDIELGMPLVPTPPTLSSTVVMVKEGT